MKFSINGNKFKYFMSNEINLNKNKIKSICNKNKIDGLVLVYLEKNNNSWKFYNNDGIEANMCGNASCGLIEFLYLKEMLKKEEVFEWKTKNSIIKGKKKLNNLNEILIDIPKVLNEYVSDEGWFLYETGVRHLVKIFQDEDLIFDLKKAIFLRNKYNANINFCSIKNDKIIIRTYEKGVEEETESCGTGTISSIYHLNKIKNNYNEKKIIFLNGSEVKIKFNFNDFETSKVCYTSYVKIIK